jgi:hypothetical protein
MHAGRGNSVTETPGNNVTVDTEGQRLMNQAFFEKLYVYEGDVTEVVFNPPFGDLLGAQEALRAQPTYERRSALPTLPWSFAQSGPEDLSETLATIFLGDGLSNEVMVGAEGLEPPTCWL